MGFLGSSLKCAFGLPTNELDVHGCWLAKRIFQATATAAMLQSVVFAVGYRWPFFPIGLLSTSVSSFMAHPKWSYLVGNEKPLETQSCHHSTHSRHLDIFFNPWWSWCSFWVPDQWNHLGLAGTQGPVGKLGTTGTNLGTLDESGRKESHVKKLRG